MTEASAPAPIGASISDGTGPAVPLVSDAYRRYALVVLMLVYTLNFLDRQIVTILAEPIKNDLGLADWQLGLMTGLAFAIFYTVLGLPIARLAESFNRVWIIGGSLAVWSGFTVLCGQAGSFAQLVGARIGVGIGEAGCTPTAHSLIADYAPKEKRASALAFFSIGTPLGGLLGLAMGGLIADAYGWRTAFLVAGLPGLLFTIVVFLTLKEPRKAMSAAAAAAHAPGKGHFSATLKYLRGKPVFWLIAFAAAVKAFIGYGHAPFTASFFLRNHAEEVAQMADRFGLGSVGFLGLALGLMGGTAGIISSWAGGAIADWAAKRDIRAYMSVPAVASLISPFIYATAILLPSAFWALWLLILPGLLGSLWYGPVYASAQSLVPPQMRATSASILIFIINLVGLGLGPLFVGILSDVLANGPLELGSAEGVRWALILSAFLGVIATALFWLARRTIREELVS
ncbi:MFS transporter [Phenylobacterium sp.]|uniref:spinster family MFS transporter n=1 Tax=Phenylobacterium sp. TaxID=1871053 RepID=UPI00286E0994|nr:MFS transporter [Phenylobacterium sp.]